MNTWDGEPHEGSALHRTPPWSSTTAATTATTTAPPSVHADGVDVAALRAEVRVPPPGSALRRAWSRVVAKG